MAENTTVNKVVINNETVIDITDTTATPGTVANGQVFYKASGERATGTMVETDPVFVASPAYGITSSDIAEWDSKVKKFTITVTETTSGSETTYTADKTFTEIVAAYNSGDILEVVISGTESVLSLANADTSEYGTFIFSNNAIGDGWASSEEIHIDFENNTNYYYVSFNETDPTVPSWAKQPTKPTYTASEVGALPSTTVIPSKTSDLTNDSGFLTSHQPVVQTLTSGTAIGSVGGTVLYAPASSTPEIFIGSTTPSGYTMWIDPEGMLVDANEVEY